MIKISRVFLEIANVAIFTNVANLTKWLFARLSHMKCIRLGSMRSSHLTFKMHYVRSSLHVFAPTGE